MLGVAQDLKEPQRDGPADAQLLSGGALSSFAQQRRWFVDRLQPGNPAHHQPAALRLTGPLDASAAERSLSEIVRRHEALRTVFRTVGSELIQVVLPDVPCPLPIVELSHLPAVDREAEAARRAAVEFRRPFDLERGPLLRAGLLRLADEDHLLWLEVHQIACDGWSMGVLFQDFAALYAAFLRGEPSPLPLLPVRYADYAAAQRARMQGETLRKHLTYWKQQLDGLAESLDLPTDRPRPVEPSLQGGTRFFSLPRALTEALESLGRREVSWLFMTLLAGFQALLQRYTGQNDIAVVTPAADRPRRELQQMIGSFINVLVLRTDLSGDPSFRKLLRRVRTMALGAYAHQGLPFEQVVGELPPSRQPLLRVMFTLLNDPTSGMALPGLKLAPIAVDCGAAQMDLSLRLTQTAAGLDGSFEYNSDLFDAATIDRMIGHFRLLLEAVVADPDRRLSELPPLGTDHKGQLSGSRPEHEVEAPARGEADGPATNPSHTLLIQLWEDLLGVRPIGIRDNFFELGGDSLLAMRLIVEVEQATGRKLPLAALIAGATIESMTEALLERKPKQAESDLLEIQPGTCAPPFFYLHGDFNGGGLYCRNLARHLGKDQPFYVLHPHGLLRKQLLPSIEAMAVDHLGTLRAFQPHGPYFLGGHCNGGFVALEMARRLLAAGETVPVVILIDVPALRRNRIRGLSEMTSTLRRLILGEPRRLVKAALRRLLRLPRLLPGKPRPPEPNLADWRKTLLDHYEELVANYAARPYPGRIVLLQTGKSVDGTGDPSAAWTYLANDLDFRVVPGHHFNILTRGAKELAQHIRTCLHQAMEQRPHPLTEHIQGDIYENAVP
jgi:thioesterase domain-containing protein/acyl carrier protein